MLSSHSYKKLYLPVLMMGRYWIFSLYIIGIQFTNTNTQLSQKYSWATILYWFRFFDGAKILSYCIIWIYNKNNLHFVSNTAFNRRWNTDVGRRHPSIWFFLNKLRKAEVKCTLSVNHADNGQNHEILKPAISGFYIRFHSVCRPCFYFIRKHMTPFY